MIEFTATIVTGTSKYDQTKRTARIIADSLALAVENAERKAARWGGQVESISRVVFE